MALLHRNAERLQKRCFGRLVISPVRLFECLICRGHDFAEDLLIGFIQLVEGAFVDRHQTEAIGDRHIGHVTDFGIPLQQQRTHRWGRDNIDQTGLQPRQHIRDGQDDR